MTMQAEQEAAVNLLVEAHEELKNLNPGHELLKFIIEITPDKVKYTKDEELIKEYGKRFPATNPGNPNSTFQHPVYSIIRHERALREAIERER